MPCSHHAPRAGAGSRAQPGAGHADRARGAGADARRGPHRRAAVHRRRQPALPGRGAGQAQAAAGGGHARPPGRAHAHGGAAPARLPHTRPR